jgi:plasmid stability protein
MASLTLQNIPDDLLARLRAAAGEERRSLAQEVLVFIEEALATRVDVDREPPRDTAAQAAAWRELAGTWRSDRSADEEIADLYAQRSLGREVDL